jgi:hypothetical protein
MMMMMLYCRMHVFHTCPPTSSGSWQRLSQTHLEWLPQQKMLFKVLFQILHGPVTVASINVNQDFIKDVLPAGAA